MRRFPASRALVVLAAVAGCGCGGTTPVAGDAAIEVAPDAPRDPTGSDPGEPDNDGASDLPQPDPAATEAGVPDAAGEASPDPSGGDAPDTDMVDELLSDGGPDAAEDVEYVTDVAGETGGFVPPAPVGCVTAVGSGHHVFPCQGLEFDVEVPEACATAPCGLILDIHGLTMNAKQEDNNTDMRALGGQYGYIVVQPSAKDPPPLAKWTTWEDDVKVMAFATDAFAAWHTDPDRFHVMGFSQGGFMTWRLLCKHSDIIASAAAAGSCAGYGIDLPYVGSLSEVGCSFTGTDLPANEIPVLQMHGTLDVIIPYFCGDALRKAVIAAWSLAETATLSSDDHHWWKRYTSPSGNVYEFISHDYRSKSFVFQGHCIPGSADLDGGEPGQVLGGFGCKDASPFVWGESAMQFFIAHPRAGGGVMAR
jgi:dienelactone hydrolase